MNPWGGFGLAHAKQAPMQQLCRILLEIDENAPQPIFRGWQRTILLGGVASRQPTPPVQGPGGHVPQERLRKRGHQRAKLIDGQARQIQDIRRMRGKIVIP
jgi:hypothetical protein